MARLFFSSPELLEQRIAPAGLLKITGDRKTATWDDVDGDKVTLKATKPVFDMDDFHFIDSDFGKQLARLDLNDADKGVGLTFTAKRDAVRHVGDGSVNVGRIEATAVDLGAISIHGDLGSIYAGDNNRATPAVKSIVVSSAGAYFTLNQSDSLAGVGPDVGWIFEGKLGPVTVKGDFRATLDIRDSSVSNFGLSANASSSTITINGSVLGGTDTFSPIENIGIGFIHAQGSLGAIKILGSIDAQGSTTFAAGSISAKGNIASVSVGGNLVGGQADRTGSIVADRMLGAVTVKGSVRGGFTPLESDGDVAKDTDGNPLFVFLSGSIGSATSVGAVHIGELRPGYGYFCGAIFTAHGSHGNIKSVTVDGNLGGYTFVETQDMSSYPAFNGIYADGQLGPVVAGSVGGQSESNPVPIAALGKMQPKTALEALAIASVTVKRGADAMLILAGVSDYYEPLNPDVQIGAVKVADNLTGSSIAVGIYAAQSRFGAEDNTLIVAAPADDRPGIRSRIGSLTVGGSIFGSFDPEFVTGAVAQEIGKVKIGGALLELSPGTRDAFSVGIFPNFTVREIGM